MQGLQGAAQFGFVGHFDHHRGWPENLLLQQLVAVEQQAHISLEQLCPGLVANLLGTGQMAHARVLLQALYAAGIAAQGTGIEHGLRWLVGHLRSQCRDEGAERFTGNANDQPGVGAELPATQYHRCGEFLGHLLAAGLQRRRQHQHRVDAAHFGEHRDRLRARCGQVAQGTAALERTGETDRLDRRVAHQRFTDTGAIDHVEHASGHAGSHRRTLDGFSHQLGSGHMAAVGLDHYRAAGSQCCGGVAAGRGERQREVAGAEHGHRAKAGAVLAQVRAWQWLALWLRAVDARPQVVATAQYLGEQAHLVAGAATLALDACSRQRSFAAHRGDEAIVQRVQLVGNGLQKLRAALWRQGVVFGKCCFGGLGGGGHLLRGGLGEDHRQCFAGACIQALQAYAAGSAALAANEVASRHG
ncbi:hypothetical protein D3C78_370850 [compost metagenome]